MDSDLQLEHAQIRHRHEAIRCELVATELDLAITLCQVATTTYDPARRDRNISNAQQAYAAAVHFLRYNHLQTTLDLEIKGKLSLLSSMLGMAEMQAAERRSPRVVAFPSLPSARPSGRYLPRLDVKTKLTACQEANRRKSVPAQD